MNWVRSRSRRWAFYTGIVSAIFLAKNLVFHSKSKHIQTKYHFIRYLVEDKLVILEKICGSKNPADMSTKGVTIEKLKLKLRSSISLLA